MAKLTLADISQFDTAAIATINANNALIEAALENTHSRDGTTPNDMDAQLDMNGYRIINLPAPAAGTDPARFVDLTSVAQITGIAVRRHRRGNSPCNAIRQPQSGWQADNYYSISPSASCEYHSGYTTAAATIYWNTTSSSTFFRLWDSNFFKRTTAATACSHDSFNRRG